MPASPAPRQPPAANIFTRRAATRATSFDEATRTFSAVAATETPVRRTDYDGTYLEVLSLSPEAIRLDRLRDGVAPLLESHRSGSTSDRIGIVTDARNESGRLVVTARLSSREDVAPLVADFTGGTPPNVSIGYMVHASREERDAAGNRVIVRTDWEPFEISLVAIPADPNTHVRNQRGYSMPEGSQDIETIDGAETDRRPSNRSQSRQASGESRNLSALSAREMMDLCEMAQRHNMPSDFVRAQLDSNATVADFRAGVLDRVADRASATRINPRTPAPGDDSFNNPEFVARTIGDVLYARMSGQAPSGAAAELAGRSLLELGALNLETRGETVSWKNRNSVADAILQRSGAGQHATSDFPVLLAGAGRRVLLDAYRAAESPLKSVARRRDVPDFRPVTVARLSEPPALKKVNEGGEVQYGSRAESKETFRVETFGRIFSLSRNAIINDDLGAFSDVSSDWGRAAAETETNLLIDLFGLNGGDGPLLDDGNPVYGTARGNKDAAAGAPAEGTLSAARLAMRMTKGIDGKTIIGVTPRHIVVGADYETETEKLLTAIAATDVESANPFAGKFTLHVEPRLTGKGWRIFADPAQQASLLVAYLQGGGGPEVDTQDGWDRLGVEFRAVLDFGCGFIDWRGTYLNPAA